MTNHADLEINLHRWDPKNFAIELRYSQPESDADVRLVQDGPALVQFDAEQLRALASDAATYGRLLSDSLFAAPAVRTAFANARVGAQSLQVPLRLRLVISPSAPELHGLHWETLRDPNDGTALLTGEHVFFSRYLSSQDWRPVRPRPEGSLRALVVIANPDGLSAYQPGGRALAPVDVAGELKRAQAGLENIAVTALASPGTATLDHLTDRLREGYDLLYLVCHGALVRGEPRLWLEDEIGRVAVTGGGELVTRLRELQQQPKLVVLASCQSGGTGAEDTTSTDEGTLSALGPRLAEAGIPAVLAMQGNVSQRTVAEFMPVFFRELQRDGQIDRAMAVARGTIRQRTDSWLPVLFMRLRSGRIWYTPGLDRERPGFDKWDALLNNIVQGRCTPIFGSGLVEPLLGTSREIAWRWSEAHRYPMALQNREDLPQVAQYLAVNQDPSFPRDELGRYLRRELLRRYADELPESARSAPLDDLLGQVEARRWQVDPAEPHRVLASLPCPIYVTTCPDSLMARALAAAGKDPQVGIFSWQGEEEPTESIFAREPQYRPEVRRPLVYHLFGQLKQADSMVLTEDDHFDYLIGATSNKEGIPGVVRRALADTALLFVGFRMEDWNFRVLFRSIMSQQGGGRRRRYAHVAVQIDPEAGRIQEPELARRYLERYFQGADISIYWGNAEDFMKELHRRWSQKCQTDLL